MSIIQLDTKNKEIAQAILDVQIPAYQIEAELIQFDGIPQLKDTPSSIMESDEDFYGYYLNEELVGVVALKIDNRVVDIHRLVIHPSHFKKGIGQTLVNYVLTSFKEIDKVIVSTGTKNLPAIRLYKKLGFVEVETVEIVKGLQITRFERRYEYEGME